MLPEVGNTQERFVSLFRGFGTSAKYVMSRNGHAAAPIPLQGDHSRTVSRWALRVVGVRLDAGVVTNCVRVEPRYKAQQHTFAQSPRIQAHSGVEVRPQGWSSPLREDHHDRVIGDVLLYQMDCICLPLVKWNGPGAGA